MRRPLLIASDVDGTLIDDDMAVSPRNRAALARAVEDGAGFALCTGRPPRWIRPVADQLADPPLAVCANGAVVYDTATGEIRTAHVLEAEVLAWIAERVAAALPGAMFASERIGSGAGAEAMEFVTGPGYRHSWDNPRNIEVAAAEVLAEPAVKLLVRAPGMHSARMRDVLEPLIGARAHLTFSTSDGLVEVAAPGVTKAAALAEVAAELGVGAADVLAFGDMPNDVSLLGWAGHGVAMGNAHPELLAVADEVTASNNDSGVALVLERWWG